MICIYVFLSSLAAIISTFALAKTGEELEAKSVKDLADKVKADIAGINKKLGEYTKTTDALNTLIGTMGTDQTIAKKVKKDAETAIDAGIELKKEAYRVLHKAEDAGFDAKTAEEAATKVKTDANTAAKTAEAKIAEDAETTDKNAGADISGQITTVTNFLKDIQTKIDAARKNFHDSNLVIDEDNAAEKLKLDGQDAEKKDKDIKNDAGIAKTESESALAEANRLSATSTKQVVEDSKKRSIKALDAARAIKIRAEELKSLASAAKQACADAVKKTPALSSKLATGPQLAEDALNSMTALLSAAGEISKAIDAAINSRKKATDLFAPFAAIDRKDKADKLEKATQQQAQTLLQQDIQEREKAANQELFLQMQQIPISAGRPEEQAPIKQEISSVVSQNDQQKLAITDSQGPVIPLDENGAPINIANYNNEIYPQPANGDTVSSCLNRLKECAINAAMQTECGGTCARELNGQDHGQNCATMQDLCGNDVYNQLMNLYCKGTCNSK